MGSIRNKGLANTIGRNLFLSALFLGVFSGGTQAGYIEVSQTTHDQSLQDLTDGSAYPVSGPLTVGGVPFTLQADAVTNDFGNFNNIWASTTIFGFPTPPSNSLDIPIGVFGVTQ